LKGFFQTKKLSTINRSIPNGVQLSTNFENFFDNYKFILVYIKNNFILLLGRVNHFNLSYRT